MSSEQNRNIAKLIHQYCHQQQHQDQDQDQHPVDQCNYLESAADSGRLSKLLTGIDEINRNGNQTVDYLAFQSDLQRTSNNDRGSPNTVIQSFFVSTEPDLSRHTATNHDLPIGIVGDQPYYAGQEQQFGDALLLELESDPSNYYYSDQF